MNVTIMNVENKVFFHHIAKTAGTSLISEFRKVGFKSYDNARYDFEWNDDILDYPEFNFYHGHFTFDLLRKIKNQNIFLFTFLRNPIDRVISQYYNWKDLGKTAAEYNEIKKRNSENNDYINSERIHSEISQMSLTDFLESQHPKILDSKFNHQTRYLSSKENRDKSLDNAYAEACSNLTCSYNFFGIKELYGISCRELENALDLDLNSINTNYTTNLSKYHIDGKKKAYQISRKEYDLLLQNNEYDIRLYHYALGIFLSRSREDRNRTKIIRTITNTFSGITIT